MDLRDWGGITGQINQLAGIREASARTKMYEAAHALDEKRVDRAIRKDDEETDLSRQEAELFNAFIRDPKLMDTDAPEAASSQPATSGPSLSAALSSGIPGENDLPETAAGPRLASAMPAAASAPAPEPTPAIDFSKYDPRAVANARIKATAEQSRAWLRDEANQKQLKAKADTMYENWTRSMVKADQLLKSGNADMAKEVYVSAYNQYVKDGFQASIDPESGGIVLTSPSGKTGKIPDMDLGAAISSDIAAANPQVFLQKMIGSKLAYDQGNVKALLDPDPLYDEKGAVKAYRVTAIDPKTDRPVITVFNGRPGAPGVVPMDSGAAAGLMDKAEWDARHRKPEKGMVDIGEADKILQTTFIPRNEMGAILDPMGPAKYSYAQQFALDQVEKGIDPYKAVVSAVAALRQSEANYRDALKKYPKEADAIRAQFKTGLGYLPDDGGK